MAKLTTDERKALPAKDFAGPDRSYPVENRRHAGNAKARATDAVAHGRMSKSKESRIDAKANAVLDRGVAHLRKHHAETQTSLK